jgi:3-oxoadipate enol-lactonase
VRRAAPSNTSEKQLPWIEANGISIHYDVGGDGRSVVLLHELGGTLDSWDEIAPGLRRNYRVLRYDQRGAGLSEKVRQEFGNDTQVDDLEAVLRGVAMKPPYHFVTVAAAATQVLAFMQRHPEPVGSLVFCNPAPGVDPSRAGQLDERAAFASREGMRAALSITLDRSYPADLGNRAVYEAYRGRYLANDPVCFGFMNRALARSNMTSALADIRCPAMVVAGRQDNVRPAAVSEELASKIPGARFELIDSGHFMPSTAPAALLALLQDFFGAHAGRK